MRNRLSAIECAQSIAFRMFAVVVVAVAGRCACIQCTLKLHMREKIEVFHAMQSANNNNCASTSNGGASCTVEPVPSALFLNFEDVSTLQSGRIIRRFYLSIFLSILLFLTKHSLQIRRVHLIRYKLLANSIVKLSLVWTNSMKDRFWENIWVRKLLTHSVSQSIKIIEAISQHGWHLLLLLLLHLFLMAVPVQHWARLVRRAAFKRL